MYVCIHIYVCTYVCMYCLHCCMSVCVCVRVFPLRMDHCVCVPVCVHVELYLCMCLHVCTYVHTVQPGTYVCITQKPLYHPDMCLYHCEFC